VIVVADRNVAAPMTRPISNLIVELADVAGLTMAYRGR